jgi:hypothetical protein
MRGNNDSTFISVAMTIINTKFQTPVSSRGTRARAGRSSRDGTTTRTSSAACHSTMAVARETQTGSSLWRTASPPVLLLCWVSLIVG